MTTRRRTAVHASILAVAVTLGVSPRVAASLVHLTLLRSQPAEDEIVSPAVSSIRLWFSERPDYPRTKISLRGPSGDVTMGSTRMTNDPRSVIASIRRSLEPGDYRVYWEAAGGDGDLVYERYDFRVRAQPREQPSSTVR